MKLAISGATGGLGSLAVASLLQNGQAPSQIVALVRDKSKAKALQDAGVELRVADYEDSVGLESALAGIDRLLLVSSNKVGDRLTHHKNVIEAAKKAGVKHIVYTSLVAADRGLSPLAPDHVATEALLAESGLSHTVLRNNWYTENHLDEVVRAGEIGVIPSAAGSGKVGSASKADLADAAARALASTEYDGKTLELSGALWDFEELAAVAARIHGKPVAYTPVSAQDRQQALEAVGLPAPVAGFVSSLEDSIAKGALAFSSPDLEKLLGRKPESLEAGLRRLIAD